MAFPSTVILETFTGTDGTTPPNANWTNQVTVFTANSGVKLLTNAAVRGSVAAHCAFLRTGVAS
jgi:hypothetical protein